MFSYQTPISLVWHSPCISFSLFSLSTCFFILLFLTHIYVYIYILCCFPAKKWTRILLIALNRKVVITSLYSSTSTSASSVPPSNASSVVRQWVCQSRKKTKRSLPAFLLQFSLTSRRAAIRPSVHSNSQIRKWKNNNRLSIFRCCLFVCCCCFCTSVFWRVEICRSFYKNTFVPSATVFFPVC